jgi:hypothetical protein
MPSKFYPYIPHDVDEKSFVCVLCELEQVIGNQGSLKLQRHLKSLRTSQRFEELSNAMR